MQDIPVYAHYLLIHTRTVVLVILVHKYLKPLRQLTLRHYQLVLLNQLIHHTPKPTLTLLHSLLYVLHVRQDLIIAM